MVSWHWCLSSDHAGRTDRRVKRRETDAAPHDVVIRPDVEACQAARPVGARCFSGVLAPTSLADDLQTALRDGASPQRWSAFGDALEAVDRELRSSCPSVSSRPATVHGVRAWAESLTSERRRRVIALLGSGPPVEEPLSQSVAIGLSGIVSDPVSSLQILASGPLDTEATRVRVQAELLLYLELWKRFDKPDVGALRGLYTRLIDGGGVQPGDLRLSVLDHARRLFLAGNRDSHLLDVQLQIAEGVHG
jgi:hypothetical protein